MITQDESLERLILLAEDAVFNGDYIQARKLLDSGLMDEPGYAKLHYTLGWMYHFYQENEDLAIRHYQLAIYFDSEYEDAYKNLSAFLLTKRKYEELERLMASVRESNVLEPEFIWGTLGKIAEKKAEFNRAISYYHKALMDSTDAEDSRELRQDLRRAQFKWIKRLLRRKMSR